MKVLVVGGGGREHAIVRKLKENPSVTELYCLPGNGGIARDAVCVPIGATDLERILAFAKERKIDYAVVAPDDPLALGVVDLLEEAGIPCFGPRKNAAVIEASKVFAKDLMKRCGIPTARYESFDELDKALAYLQTAPMPTVIKADGLALGKGVIIAKTLPEAEEAVRSMMAEHRFGKSGERVVIEEFLRTGEADVSKEYVRIMKNAAANYVKDIFRRLQDHDYNPGLMRLFVVGGGGCLVRNFGKYDESRVTIDEDICATAKGYEYLSERYLLKNGGAG